MGLRRAIALWLSRGKLLVFLGRLQWRRQRHLWPRQLDRRNLNFCPGPEDPIAARDQAMAMVLRCRYEQGIMKAMARVSIREVRQDPASANGDRSVDRVDAICEVLIPRLAD